MSRTHSVPRIKTEVMADDYSDDESTFSPPALPPPIPAEESKEGITSDYIKVTEEGVHEERERDGRQEEEEEEGGHSSPEVISGPEDNELSSGGGHSEGGIFKRSTSPPSSSFGAPPPFPGHGVEDIIPKRENTRFSGPPRQSPKHVDAIRAEGHLAFLNVLHPFILNIIYWKDIKLSSLSLVTSLVILLTLYLNTLLHTVVLLLLAAMIVSLLYIVTKIAIDSFYNKSIKNPFHSYLETEISFVNEEAAVLLVRRAVADLNKYFNMTVKLVFFEDWMRSLKFVVVLFLASYLTNYLDVMTTLFLGIDILFGVPPLYTKYRIIIDNALHKAGQSLCELYGKVAAKVPFLPKLKAD